MSTTFSSERDDASQRGWQYRLHIDAPLLFALAGASSVVTWVGIVNAYRRAPPALEPALLENRRAP